MKSRITQLTRPHGADLADAGRIIACATAIASIAAGFIHISAAADHENLPVMMVGFLVVAALQVALGGLLIWRRPGPLLIAAALALMISSVGLWLVSRTAGLPLLRGGHMEPIGFKDGITVLFEMAALPGLVLLLSRNVSSVTLPSARLGTRTLGVLGAATFALMIPAFIAGGGEHHSHGEAIAMGIHDHGEDAPDHGASEVADADGHSQAGADDHHERSAEGTSGEAHDDEHSHGGDADHVEDGDQLASLTTGDGHDHGAGVHRKDTPRHTRAPHRDGGKTHGDGGGDRDRHRGDDRAHHRPGDKGRGHGNGQKPHDDDEHGDHGEDQPDCSPVLGVPIAICEPLPPPS
jgi:hypothetical protein